MADFDLIPQGLFLCRVLPWVFLSCQISVGNYCSFLLRGPPRQETKARLINGLAESRRRAERSSRPRGSRSGLIPVHSGSRRPAPLRVRQARGPNVLALSSCQWDPSVQSTDQAHMWHLKKKREVHLKRKLLVSLLVWGIILCPVVNYGYCSFSSVSL